MASTAASRPRLHSRTHIPDQQHDGDSRRAMLFRPPLSPAPSSAGSVRQQMNGRKRSRPSSPAVPYQHTPNVRHRGRQSGYFDTPGSASHLGSWASITPNASFEPAATESALSPAPFVEARYDLACGEKGALDEPGDAHSELDRCYTAGDRRRWSVGDDAQQSGLKRQRPSEPNGAPSLSAGLTSLVFGLVSGVAGRVLDFCKHSAPFKGFYSGGGQGYTLSPQSSDQDACQGRWKEADPSAQPYSPFEWVPTPIPGQYPESPPQDRAAKRKRGDAAEWVMVPSPQEREQRITQNTSRPRLSVHPPMKRMSSSSSASRSASRNRPRRPEAPTMVARRHSSTATHAGSPAAHGRSASVASPRPNGFNASPATSQHIRPSSGARSSSVAGRDSEKQSMGLSPDAQRYQVRMKRQEREQDKSMRQMNAKLQALIKEGQAALGTKVGMDVDLDDMDF